MRGDAELQAIIAKIRAIKGLARRAAPDVAESVQAALVKQIEAGTTPDGAPWAPRKADGGRALEGAEKSLVVVYVGTRILARIKGHVARHHLGRARGGLVRQILPNAGVPRELVTAIKGALVDHFTGLIQGGP